MHAPTTQTAPRTRRSIRIIAMALLAGISLQTTAVFAAPARGQNRSDVRQERRSDVRQERRSDVRQERRSDVRQERRSDVRQERRSDVRQDRREDHREERREDRREERRDDRRDDRRDHIRDEIRHDLRHHRWERWEDWQDYRRTVAAARLITGMIFATLPPQHTVVIIDGTTYYVHDDAYFIRQVEFGVVSYIVVDAPTTVVIRN